MKIGRLPDNIWKRSVRKRLDAKSFNEHSSDVVYYDDKAIIISRQRTVPACPSMGRVAVCDAVNTISAYTSNICGVNLHLYLDGRTSEEYMQHIVSDAEGTAKELGISISSFEVHVLQGLKKPFIECSAVGISEARTANNKAGAQQDIVVTGYLGMGGTVIMAEAMRDKLLGRYSENYIARALEHRKILGASEHPDIAHNSGASYIRALSEGGIYSALWDLTQNYRLGMIVDLEKMPFRQETIEFANELDLNPYEMLSTGGYLMTTSDGERLVEAFSDKGIPAVIIGRTNSSNDKLIINDEEQRYLTVPASDSIYEIV